MRFGVQQTTQATIFPVLNWESRIGQAVSRNGSTVGRVGIPVFGKSIGINSKVQVGRTSHFISGPCALAGGLGFLFYGFDIPTTLESKLEVFSHFMESRFLRFSVKWDKEGVSNLNFGGWNLLACARDIANLFPNLCIWRTPSPTVSSRAFHANSQKVTSRAMTHPPTRTTKTPPTFASLNGLTLSLPPPSYIPYKIFNLTT